MSFIKQLIPIVGFLIFLAIVSHDPLANDDWMWQMDRDMADGILPDPYDDA